VVVGVVVAAILQDELVSSSLSAFSSASRLYSGLFCLPLLQARGSESYASSAVECAMLRSVE
jgi:hypothetical protein